MSDLAITTMTGRLVRDPIIKNEGSKMGLFTIAANRRYRDRSDTWQEETAFVACKCFGKWTESLAHHKKGDAVLVEGRLRTESWDDDGMKRSQLVLVCGSLRFITFDQRPQELKESGGAGDKAEARPNGGKADDDVPF